MFFTQSHLISMTPHIVSAISTAAFISGGILYQERINKKQGNDQQVEEYIATLATAAAITGSVIGTVLLAFIC